MLAISATTFCAGAASPRTESPATFRVDITLMPPATCATERLDGLDGAVARVYCLTLERPAFLALGRTGFFDRTCVPGAPSAGLRTAQRCRDGSSTAHGAVVQARPGEDPPREIEVSF